MQVISDCEITDLSRLVDQGAGLSIGQEKAVNNIFKIISIQTPQQTNFFPGMFALLHVHWDYFSDGSPNVKFPSGVMKNKRVINLISNFDLTNFIEQLTLLRVLPKQQVKSLHNWLGYFNTATHDRVDEPGILATAEPMMKLISNGIPLTKEGPAELVIADIHALQEQFYGTDDLTYIIT
jgi:hypothetical protein